MTFSTQRKRGHHAFIVLMVAILALMPTYTALAEIYATPVVDPTPTPTEDAVEQTTSDTQEPSQLQNDNLVSPLSTDGTDLLRDCSTPSSSIVPGGDPVVVVCDVPVGLLTVLFRVLILRPKMPDGFEAAIHFESTLLGLPGQNLPLGTSELYAWLNLPASLDFQIDIVITIRATKYDPSAPRLFEERFEGCTRIILLTPPECRSLSSYVDIVLVIEPVEYTQGTNFSFGCEPPVTPTVGLSQTATYNCMISDVNIGSSQALAINHLASSMEEIRGWDIAYTRPNGEPLLIDPRHDDYRLLNGESFSFQVRLTPTGCSARSTPATFQANVRFTPMSMSNRLGEDITGVSGELPIDFTPTGTSHAEILSSEELLNVNVPFSLVTTTTKTPLVMRILVNGCASQQLTAAMTPFTWVDPEKGGGPTRHDAPLVPALSNSQHLETESEQGVTVDEVPVSGPLSQNSENPTPLITVTSIDGSSTSVNHTIELQYTVPANTPVGTYVSTITVTTSDAP